VLEHGVSPKILLEAIPHRQRMRNWRLGEILVERWWAACSYSQDVEEMDGVGKMYYYFV
jgi:hypothetical protein